jgi:cytochrome b561
MEKRFTPLFRIWHLLNLLAVSGLAFTGLARLTFLEKHKIADIITQRLAQLHISIPQDEAISIAKAIRAGVWEWHYPFAALLGVAIALRIYLMFKKEAELPLISLLKSDGMQERLKHLVHLLICIGIGVMAISGVLDHYHELFGIAKESVEWAGELHSGIFLPLVLLIVLHIAGVVKYELSSKESIVSKMIHGE